MKTCEPSRSRCPISRAALALRLAILVESGVLERDPPDTKRANYRLTDSGRGLLPVYSVMADWSGKHLFPEGRAPAPWEHEN